MYARTVEGKELNFQVSGMLWKRSLVMRDVETGSLWSHLLGKAMRGRLAGSELEVLPAVMTTWAGWRARYPATTVLGLSRTAQRYDAQVWKRPERFVFGVLLGAGRPSPAVALKTLQDAFLVNLEAAGSPVMVTYSPEGFRAQAFDRKVGEKVLTFARAGSGHMTDDLTKSTWEVVTGQCVQGEMRGERLVLRPGTISYREAWQEFFPAGRIIE